MHLTKTVLKRAVKKAEGRVEERRGNCPLCPGKLDGSRGTKKKKGGLWGKNKKMVWCLGKKEG